MFRELLALLSVGKEGTFKTIREIKETAIDVAPHILLCWAIRKDKKMWFNTR